MGLTLILSVKVFPSFQKCCLIIRNSPILQTVNLSMESRKHGHTAICKLALNIRAVTKSAGDFPLASVSISPGYFHWKQQESRTKRNSNNEPVRNLGSTCSQCCTQVTLDSLFWFYFSCEKPPLRHSLLHIRF